MGGPAVIGGARPRNTASLFFSGVDESDQRARLLEAMARAVAHKGFAKTTVADVVALAGVSRRTFYELFADKEDCFLDADRTGSDALIRAVATDVLISGADGWHERMRVGLEAYTGLLAADPDFARALLVDVLGAGPRAVQLRREVFSSFVDLFRPAPGGLPDPYLRALVGGISELVQEQILAEGAGTLSDLAPTLVELAYSVVEPAAPRRFPRLRAVRSAGSAR